MRKRNKICFSIFIFIFSILFTSLSIKAATFNEEELGEPELSIDYYNLSHSSEIYIAYAVKASGFDAETNEVKMLFWDEYQTEGYDKGTESYLSSSIGTTTINDNNYYVFYSRGLAAKQLTD